MDFRMLGPLEAWHENTQVQLGDQQQRFVLVVLLLHANRPVSTDRLTEIIWRDNPDRRVLVRSYINRLRTAFGDSGDVQIDRTATGYLLRVDEDRLDTVRFDRLRTEAEAARATDPRRAIELLRTAVGLWRGWFLEDIDIDRVGGVEVISPDVSYHDVLGDLAELELETGDHRSARDRLRPVVQADPASQRHAMLLMRALLAGEDETGAIRVFESTRNALAEFDTEPGPVLRNLLARAQRGEPRSSLPPRPGEFTGRATELASILAAARAEGERRAMWVSGPPGVGKSGLAIEAGYRLRGQFPDGQLLVRLNGFTPGVSAMPVADALTQLLAELGVPAEQVPPTVGRKVSLYQSTLQGTRTLVVLDNAATADQVRPLLPEAPGCLAIVTSRRMATPEFRPHIRLAPLSPAEAIALFRALVGTARVRGQSTEVAELVRRCGLLPMPIQVAAALFRRHDRWPLDHLLRLLAESGPWGGATAGSAAVRVSYQQLPEPHQLMFRLFGGLPGADLDVAGAAAVAHCSIGAARTVLDELHEVSLLDEVAPERYRMLDPLKEFAAVLPLASRTELADALLRLLDFYLVTLAAAAGVGYPFDQAQLPVVHRNSPVAPVFADPDAARRWIAAERDNLVAAIHYAVAHELPEHAWQLAVLLWRHFNTNNQLEDWLETMELAWQTVRADPANEYGQAHVLLRLAIAHDRHGELSKALELANRALPIWTRLGDLRGEAATLCEIAIPTMELGEHDQANALLAAALAKFEQSDDQRGQAHALSMLGWLNDQRGDLAVALGQHQRAAAMLREIGHLSGLAHALNNLGSVRQRLGQLPEAEASYAEAYKQAIAVGDHLAEAYALNNVGVVHRLAGRLDDAVRFQELAGVVAAELSDADLHIQLDLERAATSVARAEYSAALRAYQKALNLAAKTGNRAHQARAHRGLAQTRHVLGDHEGAIADWDAAEAEFTALGLPEADELRAERAALGCACR